MNTKTGWMNEKLYGWMDGWLDKPAPLIDEWNDRLIVGCPTV